MHPVAHGLSSLLVFFILTKILPNNYTFFSLYLPIFIFFSILPDLDNFWKRMHLKDHHHSLFHAPLFWILISGVGMGLEYMFLQTIFSFSFLLLIAIQFHILTDYITARSAGIVWLYPFSQKTYGLFPLRPELGAFDFLRAIPELKKAYATFYFSNKKLLLFEITISMLGLGIFFLQII
jgi:hypothetical protein